MQINNFRELYLAGLSEFRDANEQMARLLTEAADRAKHDALKQVFRSHGEEHQKRGGQLRQMLEAHGVNPDMHKDQAMQAMVSEAKKMMGMLKGDDLADAGVLASVQKIAHYGIATGGTLATYADYLGLKDDQRHLHQIVEDERQADQKLTAIAKTSVNWDAADKA